MHARVAAALYATLVFCLPAGQGCARETAAAPPTRSATTATLPPGEATEPLPFGARVLRVFPTSKKGEVTPVVVSLDPKHFTRGDLTVLASALKEVFADKTILKVGLVDNANTARAFLEGKIDYPSYLTAERGRYYLNRRTAEETVAFTPLGSKKREVIRLGRKRS